MDPDEISEACPASLKCEVRSLPDFRLPTSDLQVLQQSAEGVVDDLSEITNERRDVALVHRGRDGHRVGDEEPDRRRGQQDADDGDQGEEAHADALQDHGTSRTILPNWPESSKRCCAAAASASG